MEMVIDAKGGVRCIYGEEIDLSALGQVSICRAAMSSLMVRVNGGRTLARSMGRSSGPSRAAQKR